MSKKLYVMDACAFIEAAHNYNMIKKSFSHIWSTLEALIDKGFLISSTEVLDELKDDDLKQWARNHRECFFDLTQDIQEKASEILDRFPNLIKLRSSSNSNADPFLIATAVIHNGCVVTNERLGDENTKDYRIPNVCRALGIPYMNLRDFLDEVLE
ncbi:MAG: DUF4411 family protein [Lachnospiraceae bacterium]|nr:DUF4411 family protein [Lachnospiraceae bacterium]